MKGGTELGRVRGLGSAKHGTHHWWNQRLTAGANLVLMAWFIISLARLPAFDHATIAAWVSSAWVALPLILLTLSVCWHMRLGLQIVIEDYQHDESRVVLMVLLNFYAVAVAAVAIFAILRLAFAGHA
jgi:succinate dehydrogenase / fumarate reductase membrane anchor subunit